MIKISPYQYNPQPIAVLTTGNFLTHRVGRRSWKCLGTTGYVKGGPDREAEFVYLYKYSYRR